MNILLALFLIIFEAVFEGLKIGGNHVASEIVEFIYLVVISLTAFAWLNKKYIFKDVKADKFIVIVIGFFLLRFGLFDSIWNIAAGQEWNFYGSTKWYDQFMTKLGSWGWMMKAIATFWGIAWLIGWREGINKFRKINKTY